MTTFPYFSMSIRINAPDIIQETFDDESVIVNLRQGLYYSLNKTALPLWEEIVKGTCLDQLHAGGHEFSADKVVGFLKELRAENLIIVEGEDIPEAGSPTDFLQKFEDLQDLLLLDPIHDVDERGWPHAKPSGDSAHGA